MSQLTSLIIERLSECDRTIFHSKNSANKWQSHNSKDILLDITAVVSGLRQNGVTLNSRICCLMDSSYEKVIFDLAALCIGAVIIPILTFQTYISHAVARIYLI